MTMKGNQYIRDVAFAEERTRILDNSGIMTRARNVALNIMRHNSIINVIQTLRHGALKLDNALEYKVIKSALNLPGIG